MKTLIDGEIVDTYGGDYTYRDVYYDMEDGKYVFYEQYFGAESSPMEKITDEEEIAELLEAINE